MDPHDPNSSSESDLAAGSSSTAHNPEQAPASSLMSIQIRRRTPPRDRPTVPPAPPAPAAPQALHSERPSAPPAPAKTLATAPRPKAPAPEVAVPAAAHPTADPGRRMQSTASPRATPADPPPALPPAAAAAPAPTARSPLNAPGIARHTRGANGRTAEGDKPHLAMPATKPAAPKLSPEQAANPPVPPEAGQEATEPAAMVRRPEGIVSYWLRLRGSRRYPSTADLDQNRIGTDWPNSILMRCRSGSKALEPEKVFTSPDKVAPAASAGMSQAAMELSPMMLQWLLTLAGDAAKDCRPMQDTEAFPSHNQSIRYGAFALPFSEDQSQIDHVLCHVYRAD